MPKYIYMYIYCILLFKFLDCLILLDVLMFNKYFYFPTFSQ